VALPLFGFCEGGSLGLRGFATQAEHLQVAAGWLQVAAGRVQVGCRQVKAG
jgi:hypothetical protein